MSTMERIGAVSLLAVVGLFMTTMGFHLATNRHGFLDWFAAESRRSVALLARIPPWRWFADPARVDIVHPFERGALRVSGWVFLVVGPVITVAGGLAAAFGDPSQQTASGVDLPRGPGSVVLAGAMALSAMLLARGAFVRNAWRRGSAARLGVAGLGTGVGVLVTGVAVGSIAAFLVGWSVGALAVVIHTWCGWWRDTVSGVDEVP